MRPDCSPVPRHGLVLVPALIAALGGGCGDFGVKAHNTAPQVAITHGPGGAAFADDETVTVEAQVWDNEDDAADLEVFASVDGQELEDPVPGPDGEISIELPAGDYDAGEHTLVLTVVDTDGDSGSDSDTFSVVSGEPPTVEIVAPTDSDVICAGETLLFEGQADDPDGGTDALTASWTSDVDGPLAEGQDVSADGYTSAAASFTTAGDHLLTLTVADPDGVEGADSVLLEVLAAEDCNEAPAVTLDAPLDGDAFLEGACITFEGTATDAEDDPEDLAITWTSSIDGLLDETPPDGNGGVTFEHCALTTGDHQVELVATDSLGATAEALVSFEVCPDADGDGYGTCTGPNGEIDCDDGDATVFPGATELCDGLDNDCDGVIPADEVDGDGDGVAPCAGDCDDADATTFPGAAEICDGIDNDCDGSLPADELDPDGDGVDECSGDCDDGDAAVFPGAPELCDGLDNDCDGSVPADELDGDGDGVSVCAGDCDDTDPYTSPGAPEVCDGEDNDCDGSLPPQELDDDGDGFTPCDGDCDDTEGTVYPGATEFCDGLDNDCDGNTPGYENDDDGDGQAPCDGDCDDSDPSVYDGAAEICDGLDTNCDGTLPATETDDDGDGLSECDGDCDDTDPTRYPGASEACDGVDNDCDGLVPPDEADGDGDGIALCAGDCDDGDATVYPGAAEICDGQDNDCDGSAGPDEGDADGDGYPICAQDCDDGDPLIHPGAPELCDGLDNDCDGIVPANESDGDGDGVPGCAGDCDDGDATVFPGAYELCDGVDNDCDGIVPGDEGDADGDGLAGCAGDCDNTDPAVYPGAPELCDGQDNDCDGNVPADETDGDGDGYAPCADDCDDGDAAVHPGATEACNGIDDDCDGSIPADEDDGDGDGYRGCEGDCDDGDAAVHPGATEVCNGLDDDCDGNVPADEIDGDGDGYADCDGDCDDGAADVYPGAPEPCDGIDHDCDGIAGGGDADGDGVCDADDVCPNGDDNLDMDGDGIPDDCDGDTEMDIYVGPDLPEHDVAADGFMATVRATGGEIRVTCYEPDRSLRRAEFATGTYDSTNAVAIYVSRESQNVFVAWRDYDPGVETLRYSYLDPDCQPLVEDAEVFAGVYDYYEFFDAAIDDEGYVVLAYSTGETLVAWIDDTGTVLSTEQGMNIGAWYGTHVAMDQSTGAGIVTAQIHSGDGIYYRRFDSAWNWVDGSPVQINVGYHYWYDGHTIGMNDEGEFVLLWRSSDDELEMKFFDDGANEVAHVVRSTPNFNDYGFDSYRQRHPEIPLRGDNFVLGETYAYNIGDGQEVWHFEYTPEGALISENSTTYSIAEGLTIRMDDIGYAYIRDDDTVHILAGYL